MNRRMQCCFQALVVASMLTGLLCGCAGQPTPTAVPPPTATPVPKATPVPTSKPVDTPKYGGTVILGAWQEPDRLLAGNTSANVSLEAAYLVHGFLVKVTDKLQYTSDFLTEIPTVENGGISADGLTYTLHLKPGVKWHDGQPFTSQDVKFTWERQTNPDIHWQSKSGWTEVESVDTPDTETIVFHLKQPYPAFLEIWVYSPILPEHILKDVAADEWLQHPFNREPVGLGPFVFTEWVEGDHITFDRNPNYAVPELPYLDRVIYKIVPDKTVLLAQLEKGEVDTFFYIGTEQFQSASQLDNITLFETQALSHFNIWVNQKREDLPWHNNKQVRQALAYGYDKRGIVKAVLGDVVRPADGPVPPQSWAFKPDVKRYDHDPEKAKQMLTEAGWVDSDGDGIREKDGQKFSFELQNVPGEAERLQILQLIQSQWKEIGVDMQIVAVKLPELQQAQRDATYAMNYTFNTMKVDPGMCWRYCCGMGSNSLHWCNERVDELLKEADRIVDVERRKEIFWEFQDIYAEEVPAFSIYWRMLWDGVNKRIHGAKTSPVRGGPYWNIAEWWVE